MQVVIRWFPFLLAAMAAPMRAILLDSVPPEVKTISFSFTFREPAISSRASRMYRSASTPFICLEEVLP